MKEQKSAPATGEHKLKELANAPESVGEQKPEKLANAWGLPDVVRKVQSHSRGMLDEHLYRKSSVLVPLLLNEKGNVAVLFEKRAHKVRQPGDICFPGGKLDAGDANAWEAARRETSEELRIPKESIHWVSELDYLIHHDRSIVYPYTGMIHGYHRFDPNPDEVAEVFCIELDELLQAKAEYHQLSFKPDPDATFPFHLIQNGANYSWRVSTFPTPFYYVGGRVIWGMTARILSHFLEIIRKES